MKKFTGVIFLSHLVLVVLVQTVMAGDVYEFPEITPEYSLWTGFTLLDVDGAPRANEYRYLHDSLAGGGDLSTYPFPHRIHLGADVYNKYDYFGHARYAYEDELLSRFISRKVYHNLENKVLVDPDPSTASPGIDRRDVGVDHAVRTGNHDYFVRLKMPDYPLHVYGDGRAVLQKGTKQQRFMGGSGYFNDIKRISIQREVNEETTEYSIGTNNHLGPIEMNLRYSEMEFTPKGADVLLTEQYSQADESSTLLRAAGVYPHNVLPRLKQSTTTFQIHTSYTGKIVGSAAVSDSNRKNETSNAEADYLIGEGSLVLRPNTRIALTTTYHYQKTDLDNPDSVTVTDFSKPANTNTITGIKPSISSRRTIFSQAVRYRTPWKVTVEGKYKRNRKKISRQDAELWLRPNKTIHDTYELCLNWYGLRKAKVRAKYIYKDTSHRSTVPFINGEPEQSDKGILSLSYTPTIWMNALLEGNITSDSTHDLQIFDANGLLVNDARDAESYRWRLFESITFQLTEKLSITESYSYMNNKIDRDLVYGRWPPEDPLVDQDVRNQDRVYSFAVNVLYKYRKNSRANLMFDYTKSTSRFSPTAQDALDPVSIGLFSETEIKEFTIRFDGDYEFKEKWGVGVGLEYKDVKDSSFDSPEQGSYLAGSMEISKRW